MMPFHMFFFTDLTPDYPAERQAATYSTVP